MPICWALHSGGYRRADDSPINARVEFKVRVKQKTDSVRSECLGVVLYGDSRSGGGDQEVIFAAAGSDGFCHPLGRDTATCPGLTI